MKLINVFKKLEFSKKLAVIVVFLYIVMLILSIVFQVGFSKDITNIFEYVQYSFTIVLSAYLLKSGAENITKIKVSDLFKSTKEEEIVTESVSEDNTNSVG